MLYRNVFSFVTLCCISACWGAAVFRRNKEDKRLEVRADQTTSCNGHLGSMPSNVSLRSCRRSRSYGECTSTCKTGYRFPDGTVQKTSTCRNGRWSSTATVGCRFVERNPTYTGTCELLPEAPEGTSSWSCSSHEYEGNCQFDCRDGLFLPNGERQLTVTCRNGHWSERVPDACVPLQDDSANVSCNNRPSQPRNSHGLPECETTRESGNCKVRCDRGYVSPNGRRNAKASCRNGRWTSRNWACVRSS